MKALTRIRFADYAWTMETYHREIKQYCGVERAQVCAARTQPTTSWRCALSHIWSGIVIKRVSVGLRLNSLSSDPPLSAPIWLIHFTYFPQLRNSSFYMFGI